jgi:hypothetical protein
MTTTYMDYSSPNTKFTYDLNKNVFYKIDNQNYITALTIQQLNTLGNSALLDIFLSTGVTVEPHIHQNATELVYCISGSAIVSIINPFTKELLNYPITPGQVANVPQGWWHYEIATVDHTHLLAVFDAPMIDTIFGSDIFRLTPSRVLAHTYCLDEATVKQAFAPITKTVILGPPSDCNKMMPHMTSTAAAAQNAAMQPKQLPVSVNQAQRFHKPGCIYYQHPAQPQFDYPQQP